LRNNNKEETTNNNSKICNDGTREAHFGEIPPEILEELLEELSTSKPYTYASAIAKPVVAPIVSAPVVSKLVVLEPVTATSPINRDTTPKPNIVTPWRMCIQKSWADYSSDEDDDDL
jgi:hypothetical protein